MVGSGEHAARAAARALPEPLPPTRLSPPAGQPPWTIHVVNDTCADTTWGFDEKTTRRNMAELVRSHLDAMTRTDGEPEWNRDRYTMAVTNEALAFLEHYPERKDELVRRLREGRITLSPFLNNTLWGWQSEEAFLRSLYPARRLERAWGVPIDVAHHTELPSLPWGAATLLAGAGVRWLAVPFLDYDSEWGGLEVPPLFVLEGPDGGRVRVVLDAWASRRHNYTQGRALLEDPKRIGRGVAPALRGRSARPTRSGTSSPSARTGTSARRAPGRSSGSRRRSGTGTPRRRRPPVSSTRRSPAFCRSIDAAEASRSLPTLRGDLGHSWEAWPVTLAAHAAAARQAEREMLVAEALAALAGGDALAAATREPRESAEWSWAMLGDHAWNGTDDANRLENASLRRRWADDARGHRARPGAGGPGRRPASSTGPRPSSLFNPTGAARQDVVRFPVPPGRPIREARDADGHALPSQLVLEDEQPVLYFVPPRLAAFSTTTLRLASGGPPPPTVLTATPTSLDGPFYRLTVDPRTGGLASLVHKPTGRELVVAGARTLGQTVYFDGREAEVAGFESGVETIGPVLARLHVSYRTGPAETDLFVTLYAHVDRVDFDYRVRKRAVAVEERLVHVFPVVAPGATVRLDTTGAVVRPRPAPEGDLLKGGNTRRFAIQGFVDASGPGGGVTVAPQDAFLLRNDLEPLSFEALGNDQNFKEVTKDQGGATDFGFAYSLRAHAGDFEGAEAFAWSRSVSMPIEAERGRLSRTAGPGTRRGPRARDRPRPEAPGRSGRSRPRPAAAGDSGPERSADDRGAALATRGPPRPPRAGAGSVADHGREAAARSPAHGFAAVRLE